MQACVRSWSLLLALVPLACEAPGGAEEQADAEEQDDAAEQGDPCPPAVAALPESYAMHFAGFPEVEDDEVVAPEDTLDFTGNCTITGLSFADGQLDLTLACEHPDSDDASLTLTVAATGVPAGLELEQSVELRAFAYLEQGGDLGDREVLRALSNVNVEHHTIIDEQGLIFGARRGGLGGTFGSITVEERYNCPDWTPCSVDGDISGYIRASSGEGEVEVHIGELGQLDDGALSWDVSLFQAQLGGCHGNYGSFSFFRRP
ncbi:MAG: hypothetical protein R6X02_02535 [Enhygromyxa sp.]